MYLEGLFTVIMIIVAIAGFVQKAQKEQQGSGSRPRSAQRQYPGRQYKQAIPASKRSMQRRQTGSGTGLPKGAAAFEGRETGSLQESDMLASNAEGTELESRYMTGSINYTEQENSTEGLGYEPATSDRKLTDTKKGTVSPGLTEIDETHWDFDISAEDLMRSVVMAEILGKPRAMKRSIR